MPPELSEYQITAVLLQGSTGIVYAGRFRNGGHPVAIEEIASDLRATPGFIEQLAEAGKHAAALRHPRVLAVYDMIEEDGTLCLITEMITGRQLRGLAPRGAALPPAAALAIADDVLAAVEEAHRVGVVHGDIGPDVVTVDPEGNAKLGGFAVSYAVAATAAAPPWRRPAYAPDRAAGSGAGRADDITACAALAHELLGGAPPGEAEVDIPAPLSKVLAASLNPGAKVRFSSAGALHAALTAAAVKGYGPAWREGSDLAERAQGAVPPPPSTVELPAVPLRPAAPGDVDDVAALGDVITTEAGDGAPAEPPAVTVSEPVDATVPEPVDATVPEPVDATAAEPVDATAAEAPAATVTEPVDATVPEPLDGAMADTTAGEPAAPAAGMVATDAAANAATDDGPVAIPAEDEAVHDAAPASAIAPPVPPPPPASVADAAVTPPGTPPRRRRRWPFVLALVLVVAVAVGAAAILLGAAPVVTNAGPLGVNNDVRLAVTPQRGGCNTTFRFVATGTVHGTGTLVYRFEQSDGRMTPDTPVTITPQDVSFRFTHTWRFQESQEVHATMTFRIIAPTGRSSTQAIDYSCA